MRISDWSSDVCSSDLDDVAGLESIMMKAQSCRRDRSNTGCDRKWRWVGQASNQFRDSSRGTLNGLGRINQQKPCGQKKQSSILRSEEHTSELQSLMRISYSVFCLNKNNKEK